VAFAACAALALVAVPRASASIAGAQAMPTTPAPDLRTVTITAYGRYSAGAVTSQARFCFDQTLAGASGPANLLSAAVLGKFQLQGYAAANNLEALNGFIDPTNTQCVIVNYDSFTQVRAATVGTVDRNAVTSTLGTANYADSVPVSPSDATGPLGRTTGPNILNIVPDFINNRLVFTFDHDLYDGTAAGTNTAAYTGAPDFTRFFFVDQAGVNHVGTAISVINNTATISFAAGTVLTQIATAGVNTGGVTAADGVGTTVPTGGVPFDGAVPGEPNQFQTGTPFAQTSGNPDLIGASVTGPQTVVYTFDKQLNGVCNAGSFYIQKENDRDVVVGVACGILNNINQVQITFPTGANLSGYTNQFVRAGVMGPQVVAALPVGFALDFGASAYPYTVVPGVFSFGTGQPNIASTWVLNPSGSAPGFTSAPDVTAISRASNSTVVTVTFDKQVNNGFNYCRSEFEMISPSGLPNGDFPTAVTPSATNANQVLLTFSNTGNVTSGPGIQFQGRMTNLPGFYPGSFTQATTAPPTLGPDTCAVAFYNTGVAPGPLDTVQGFSARDTMISQSVAFPPGTASLRLSKANLAAQKKALKAGKAKQHRSHRSHKK
jgi:hypothetical protein